MEPWITEFYRRLSICIDKKEKLLVAVSGGLDSTVLVHLLHHYNFSFGIAHVNYGLRENASDADQHYVESMARKLSVPLHVKKVENPNYTGSTQVWARNIRYTYFKELRSAFGYQYVVLGHHKDDQVEQFFIKTLRNTGVRSLGGMQFKDGINLRPLLHARKQELLQWANNQGLRWREDASNKDPKKYDRNWWRIIGVPMMEKRFPDLRTRISSLQQRIKTEGLAQKELLQFWLHQNVSYPVIGVQELHLESLKHSSENILAILHIWLYPLGFSEDQIIKITQADVDSESKIFSSKHAYEIELKAGNLYLYKAGDEPAKASEIYNLNELEALPIVRKISRIDARDSLEQVGKGFIFPVDSNSFPLTRRPASTADSMVPFGMQGKSVQISKILKEAGVPHCVRKNVYVWENRNGILYLEGYRSGENTRITGKTTDYCAIELN